MSTIKPADNQPNDSFGYSCYTLIILASDGIMAKGQEIEQKSGMTRAKIPAHITVKGTFYGIESIEDVKHIIRSITEKTPTFQISFEGAVSHWWDSGGALAVPVSAELQTLHDALVEALSPLGTPAYQDDPYRPHMTYVQSMLPGGLGKAKELVGKMDWGDGFQARAVDLMGRIGPAEDGRWTLVESFPLMG